MGVNIFTKNWEYDGLWWVQVKGSLPEIRTTYDDDVLFWVRNIMGDDKYEV